MTLSEQLREAIKASTMTQAELARAARVAESVLSRFKEGGQMRTDNADRVAEVLGLVLVVKTASKAGKVK